MILVKYITLQTCIKALNHCLKFSDETCANEVSIIWDTILAHVRRKSRTNAYNLQRLHALCNKFIKMEKYAYYYSIRKTAAIIEPDWLIYRAKHNAAYRARRAKNNPNYKPRYARRIDYEHKA